nr:hypothetical protein [uncultured bacterium]
MKALIAFASMSGNTEDMAAILKQTLEGKGIETEMMEFDDTSAEDLSSYDYVMIGSYTWGDGDLPYEAEDFYEEVSALELSHIKSGCIWIRRLQLSEVFARLFHTLFENYL